MKQFHAGFFQQALSFIASEGHQALYCSPPL